METQTMVLSGPVWIVDQILTAIAEQRFFVCTHDKMLAHGDVGCAKMLGLVHIGSRADNEVDRYGIARGWFRYYPTTGIVRGRKQIFVSRTGRGWLDSTGYEYLDSEVRKPQNGSE